MARKITIKLTGAAEKFMEEMENQGLSEEDVIAQGIGILEEVWRTKRVALVKEGYTEERSVTFNYETNVLAHFFYVQTPKLMRGER